MKPSQEKIDFDEIWADKPWWPVDTTDKTMAEYYYDFGKQMKQEKENPTNVSDLISRIHIAIKLLTIKNQGLTTENRALQVKTNQLAAENEQLRAEIIKKNDAVDAIKLFRKEAISILSGKAILNIAKNRSGPKFKDKKIIFDHKTTYFYQGE